MVNLDRINDPHGFEVRSVYFEQIVNRAFLKLHLSRAIYGTVNVTSAREQ